MLKTWDGLEFAVYSSRNAAGNRGIVVTQQVPADQYWCILFYDGMDLDINGQDLAHFLFQPQSPLANGPLAPDDQTKFNTSNWEPNFYLNMLRVSDGGFVSGGINFMDEISQLNSVKSPSSLNKVIVPPLWYFGMVERNGVVSGLDRTILMRMLFLRIPTGCPVPNL
jgi:hypothetical protein